jgi:hypothetical protein
MVGLFMRKALIRTSTGVVENIIELSPDDSGGYSHWLCPEGFEVIDYETPATPGGTWDGTRFIAPVIPEVPRLDVLMAEGPATQVYDEGADALVDRPAEDIAADKTELLGLLQTKLADSGDLTWEEMNKMLALERES